LTAISIQLQTELNNAPFKIIITYKLEVLFPCLDNYPPTQQEAAFRPLETLERTFHAEKCK
jgi:hypothetical protein